MEKIDTDCEQWIWKVYLNFSNRDWAPLNEGNSSKNGIRPFNVDYHPNYKTTERQYHKNIQIMTSMFGPRLTGLQLWPNKWNEKL